INIKVYLTILGYANFKTPNELYGSQTKNAVMKFQKAFNLPASGIADQDTRKKLKAEAKKKVNTNFLKSGDRHSKVTQLKKDLKIPIIILPIKQKQLSRSSKKQINFHKQE